MRGRGGGHDPRPAVPMLTTGELAWMAAPGLTGLGLSFFLDRWVEPRGHGWQRTGRSAAMQAGLFLCSWSLLWLLVGRPGFAAALTLAGQGLLVAISNAKYRALREPLVYSDLILYTQVVRFPRLYLPFLGLGRAAAVLAGLGLAIGIGLLLEPPWSGAGVWVLGLLGVGATVLVLGTRRAPAPSLDPARDLSELGLFPSLWLYGWDALRPLSEATPPEWPQAPLPLDDRSAAGPKRLPDLLLVQSESFFDARRLDPNVRPELLSHFDALCATALRRGRLTVPCWGANTMRTEFAVLSGLAEEPLGVHRFNPYLRYAWTLADTLPRRLRALGYRTVCIHPHPAGFFGRDRLFPALGFDAFIDLADFADAPRAGPYVADAAVTEKIAAVLAETPGPTFIFVITMENHGPLHLERVAPHEFERLYLSPPRPGWEDLSVYLRHLANADRMCADLAALLAQRPFGGLLCLYGDHVPSMPRVYADLGFDDGRTDYVIWSPDAATGAYRDLEAHQLPATLLTLIGASRSLRNGYNRVRPLLGRSI